MNSHQMSFLNTHRGKAPWILFFLFIPLLFSCAAKPVGISATESPPTPAVIHKVELEPGDQIEIKFAYSPEFNETQAIRPDGRIELVLVGEIVAAGKTPSQLRDELIKLYAKQLAHPDLAVMIRLSNEQRVYVGGAVNTPGVLEMPGRLTAMEAIMQAGGFDWANAEISNVIVIRFREGKRLTYSLDLGKTLSGGNNPPFYLDPKDVIYVPRTKIAEVSQWVDQHIRKIIPVSFSTGYFWSTGD